MAKAKDSVLAIFDPTGQGGGSGVVISPDGYALTNFHVVHECGKAMKCGMADGRLYDAVIVGIDPTGDVALIKLLGRDDFPHAELGDSDRVPRRRLGLRHGQPLPAGHRLPAHGHLRHHLRRPSLPVSRRARFWNTPTACRPTPRSIPATPAARCSTPEGRLIGINGRGSFEKRGRVSVGVGYAISINQIKNFLGDLQSGRIVDHATLGAVFACDSDGRVVVDDILETSDAYRRGLRMDDEMVSFGGRPDHHPQRLQERPGHLTPRVGGCR